MPRWFVKKYCSCCDRSEEISPDFDTEDEAYEWLIFDELYFDTGYKIFSRWPKEIYPYDERGFSHAKKIYEILKKEFFSLESPEIDLHFFVDSEERDY